MWDDTEREARATAVVAVGSFSYTKESFLVGEQNYRLDNLDQSSRDSKNGLKRNSGGQTLLVQVQS